VSILKARLEVFMLPPRFMWWEYQLPVQGRLVRIPESEWRYFIICFQGTNTTLSELEEIFTFSPLELRVAFTVVSSGVSGASEGWIMHPGRFAQYLEKRPVSFVDVGVSDVEQVALIHSQYTRHDPSLIDVKRLARQLLDLEALPYYSPMRFLGYFAILESLLTHQPKDTDTIDSITRQVKRKIALLDNRWQPRIDYERFQNTKPDTVWSKMYAYRSCLAHGSEPDFASDLQVLKDHNTALELLKQTVKAIIRQALLEPQLILDLREC